MALYRLETRNVSKAKQSAVAKAAYVSGERIYSERDDEYKQFRKREVLPESFIVAPAHAPEWVYDREKLWNEAERIEKPVNARVQREVLIALPIELTKEQNIELTKEYVLENFVSDGMVADVNIHFDKEDNPHAHILLTVRPFNEDGTWWETKSKKEYLKDEQGNFKLDDNGKKKSRKIDLTGWNTKEKLNLWRENLADKINLKYKEYGIDQEVTHLSYEESGQQKLPKERLTREQYYIEQKEKEVAKLEGREYVPVTKLGQTNLEIEKVNKEIESISLEIEELENQENRIETNHSNVVELKDYIERKRAMQIEEISSGSPKAIEVVLKRSKENELSYSAIQKAEKSVIAWNTVLTKDVRKLNAEKNFLENIAKIYKTEPGEVENYGFRKDSFVETYNQKISDLQTKFNELSNQIQKYNLESKSIKEIKDAHYIHLKELFDSMHPEHKEISRFKTDENAKVMDYYVSKLVEDNILNPVVEFQAYKELKTKEEHLFRTTVLNTLDNYKRYAPQYFGLNKRVQLLESQTEKLQADNSISYEKSLELHVMKQELKHVKEQLEASKTDMYKSLIELYGEEQKDVITKVPDKMKAAILKDFIDNRKVQDLSEYIQHAKDKFDNGKANYFTQQVQQLQDRSKIGNLLSQLLAQSMLQQNQGYYGEKNKKRKKTNSKGYSKGYQTKEYERGY